MNRHKFEILLGFALVILYLLFWLWHSPWEGKLTPEEIDQYMAKLHEHPVPAEQSEAIAARLRRWAEADDGKPVYMFNLIHYYLQLRTFPGAPKFKGTPQESNAYYMRQIAWLWLSHAAYPLFDGATHSENLINMQPERTWGQVTVARYPNRRTFLRLISDPSYGPAEPHKFMAMELDLVPVSGGIVVPDLRWLVGGGFVILFLLAGWIRAAWSRSTASKPVG